MPGLPNMLQANQEYAILYQEKKKKKKRLPGITFYHHQSHVSPFSYHRKVTGRLALFLGCLF